MLSLQVERVKMKVRFRLEDRKLRRSLDEASSLLAQLSSLKNEEVVNLDDIKNLRQRVYKVGKFRLVAVHVWFLFIYV